MVVKIKAMEGEKMKKFAVISFKGMDEYVDVCDDQEEALLRGEKEWNHLCKWDKKNYEYFHVAECELDEEGSVIFESINVIRTFK